MNHHEDPDMNWKTRQERDLLANEDFRRKYDRAEKIVWTIIAVVVIVTILTLFGIVAYLLNQEHAATVTVPIVIEVPSPSPTAEEAEEPEADPAVWGTEPVAIQARWER